jgi:hypothetical protein
MAVSNLSATLLWAPKPTDAERLRRLRRAFDLPLAVDVTHWADCHAAKTTEQAQGSTDRAEAEHYVPGDGAAADGGEEMGRRRITQQRSDCTERSSDNSWTARRSGRK